LTKKHDVHPCPAVKKIGIQFNLLPKKKPKIYYLGKRNQKDNCIIKKKSRKQHINHNEGL